MDPNNLASRRNPAAWLAIAVLAAAAGCVDPEEPLASFVDEGTGGAIEGLAFFDAGEDGLFDPADGDFAMIGVGLTVQRRGVEPAEVFSTRLSGSDGRYRFDGIPPGTHELVIDETTVAPTISICQNPLEVTVFIGETRLANVAGRPGCLITIAEAKDLPVGEFVVVRGIVTSFPGQIEPGMAFIQDATAGAVIFRGTSLVGLGIQVGDQIEIGAFTGLFAGLFELVEPIALRSLVADVGELQPVLVTTAEISSATITGPIQGSFVRVEGAQLIAAFGSGSLDGQNGIVDDGSGATEIRMEDNVAVEANLNTIFTVGACYNINGFGHSFNVGQMLTRSTEAGLTSGDVVEVPCP